MLKLTRPEGSKPEDFQTTRRTLGSMFFAGYALAAVSANAQEQTIHTDDIGLVAGEVGIPGSDGAVPAYAAWPAARGRYPVIIVVPEVFGIHEYIRDTVRRLAKLGYFAVAPDFFYRAGNPAPLTDFGAIQKIVATASNEQVMGDLAATIAWAGRHPSGQKRFGITGFCWGGAVVWMASQRFREIRAGVAWYGRLSKPVEGQFLADEVRPWPLDIVPTLRAPVLGLYAGQDAGIPAADVNRMNVLLVENDKRGSQMIVYEKAQHGFHADYRATYDKAAATDGWARMLQHFERNGLKGKPPKPPRG